MLGYRAQDLRILEGKKIDSFLKVVGSGWSFDYKSKGNGLELVSDSLSNLQPNMAKIKVVLSRK